MPHAKSLRAIGQSLESIGIVAFIMEKNGRNYVVRSDALPDISELSHKQSLSEKVWDSSVSARKGAHLIRDDGTIQYDPAYVSWLDAQGRKKRGKRFSAQATGTMKFSQLLRTVGRHIDRLEPHAFTVSWSRDSVSINYDLGDGQKHTEIIPIDKLRELTVRMRVRRVRRR
jgi:hypothetical protein